MREINDYVVIIFEYLPISYPEDLMVCVFNPPTIYYRW